MRFIPITLVALAVFAVGMRWNTFAIGGSDSYCYANQAQGWASGKILAPEPLVREAPWPFPEQTFAPAGHVPSQRINGAYVPMCAAGLSLAMAAFLKLGGPSSIFVVVPLFGVILVVATWILGSRFSSRVGIASAIAAGASPAFLFMIVQPMSDVPAAALWVASIAAVTGTGRWSSLIAGLLSSGAILVRPNLLPLGLVIGLFTLLRPASTVRARLRDAALYAAGCAPGCLVVAAIQQFLYGSPLQSGYGDLDGLFSSANIAPNAERYLSWLWQTHTPIWLLALVAVAALRGWRTSLLFAVALTNLACYLPYIVFNDWWYLRFVLPAIPLLLVLSLAVIDAGIGWVIARGRSQRIASHLRAAVTVGTAIVLAVAFVSVARSRFVFNLQQLESRYVSAGTYVARRLPPNAFIITSLESGSIRYYSGRRTLTWAALDTSWLDGVLKFARERGLEPYFLLERSEEPQFRERFAGSALARLDWPPIAEIDSRVRIYRPDDRQRYYAGEGMSTEYAS
jgi:hypothetical protein